MHDTFKPRPCDGMTSTTHVTQIDFVVSPYLCSQFFFRLYFHHKFFINRVLWVIKRFHKLNYAKFDECTNAKSVKSYITNEGHRFHQSSTSLFISFGYKFHRDIDTICYMGSNGVTPEI